MRHQISSLSVANAVKFRKKHVLLLLKHPGVCLGLAVLEFQDSGRATSELKFHLIVMLHFSGKREFLFFYIPLNINPHKAKYYAIHLRINNLCKESFSAGRELDFSFEGEKGPDFSKIHKEKVNFQN